VIITVPRCWGGPWQLPHQQGPTGTGILCRNRCTIPIPFPSTYDILIAQSGKSKVAPYYFSEVICPKNACTKGSLRLTPWLVSRHAVVFVELNHTEYRDTPVPLAICEVCGARPRVLPVEFLPFKTYSLPVIEQSIKGYSTLESGLRKVVGSIEGVAPHYSTLHGWVSGLGDRVMDRVPQADERMATVQPFLLPTASIVAETAKRLDSGLMQRWTETQPEIPKRKYQSDFRKERLMVCLKLLLTAASLFGSALHPLTEWEHFIGTTFFVAGWSFFSRSPLTAIQLDDIPHDFIFYPVRKQPVKARSP